MLPKRNLYSKLSIECLSDNSKYVVSLLRVPHLHLLNDTLALLTNKLCLLLITERNIQFLKVVGK